MEFVKIGYKRFVDSLTNLLEFVDSLEIRLDSWIRKCQISGFLGFGEIRSFCTMILIVSRSSPAKPTTDLESQIQLAE